MKGQVAMKSANRRDRALTGLVFVLIFLISVSFPNSTLGAFQSLPGYAGWEVDYNFVYNNYTTDLYRYNGVNRFWYNQGPGQWFDRSAVNSAWSALGPAGQSRTFMGDHNWHTFSDNKSFQLNSNNNWGVWRDNGVERFLYDYTMGQWCDHSAVNATWSCLGSAYQLSAFIGDHKWHPFTDNRSFQYYTNNQWGVWQENGQYRFLYDYATGQWKDRSVGNGTWSSLGPANQLSAYIGNHLWHDFGNGITFSFYDNNAWGTFQQNGTYRFLYDYTTGQWKDRSTADGTWYALGAPGQLSAWICDGAWHTMDSIWSYQLVGSGIGYLKGSVSLWNDDSTKKGGGSWGSSPTQFTCNYGSQVFGLYDSGNTSSVFRYERSAGALFNIKWENWNYDISSKSEISQAIAFYTGSTYHGVSSWLSWLPVNPNPGAITRTETWDFRNHDLSNRYNHEARAFANNMWVVQRAQGDYGDCGILASINIYEALTGIYAGYTQTWLETAVSNKWASGSSSDPSSYGGSWTDGNKHLIDFMGGQLNRPVTLSAYGGNTARSLPELINFVSQGQKVLIDVDLHYISAFDLTTGSRPLNSLHALALVGSTTINGVYYAGITNGWNIRSNTPVATGTDPNIAYPITWIPFSELQSAYSKMGSNLNVYLRIY